MKFTKVTYLAIVLGTMGLGACSSTDRDTASEHDKVSAYIPAPGEARGAH